MKKLIKAAFIFGCGYFYGVHARKEKQAKKEISGEYERLNDELAKNFEEETPVTKF